MLSKDRMQKINALLNAEYFDERQFDIFFNEDNVNDILIEQWTALTLAVDAGNLMAVNYFIELGADLNLNGPEGRPAIVQAAFLKEQDIVDVLIKNKAKIPLYDRDGYSLLQVAVRNELVLLTHKLVEDLKANVNEIEEADHTTPLINAAEVGHMEIVKLLIRNGAKIDLTPQLGVNALAAAAISNHSPVILFLLHSGANVNVAKKSIKSRLEEVLTLELEDVEYEINKLRTGFELLIDTVKLDSTNDISQSRYEFFNARSQMNKIRELEVESFFNRKDKGG